MKGYLLCIEARHFPSEEGQVKASLKALRAGWAWGQVKLWVRGKTVEVAHTQVGVL